MKPPPVAPPPSAKVVVHEQQQHEVPVKTTGDGTADATATKNGSSLVDAASGLPSSPSKKLSPKKQLQKQEVSQSNNYNNNNMFAQTWNAGSPIAVAPPQGHSSKASRARESLPRNPKSPSRVRPADQKREPKRDT